jgi:hypothetical protein
MASYNYTFTSGDTVTPTKLNSARTVSEIVNADVSATAAIAGTKVAPAFGAQDITVSTANRSITNTGNFALSFGTNNTERVRIAASGNVSVATTADTFRLHAYHATADCVVTSQGRATSLGGSGKASVQIDVDGTGGFALQTDSTSGPRLFRLISNSGYGLGETTALAVTSGGNVGIGTTSIGQKLTVNGNASFLGGGAVYLWNTANTAAPYIKSPASSAIAFYDTSDNERMRIDGSGNVGIGTTAPVNYANNTTLTLVGTNGSGMTFGTNNGSNRSEIYYSATETYLKTINNTSLWFGTNNAERMRIKSTGQVRFIPLSADPAGGETGDVYYNSATNKLRVYNGSWVDLH